jgi:hypothetical protein
MKNEQDWGKKLKINDIINKIKEEPQRFKKILILYFAFCIILLLPLLQPEYNQGNLPGGICNLSIFIVVMIVLWILVNECNKDSSVSGFILSINFMVLAFGGPFSFIMIFLLKLGTCLTIPFIYCCLLGIISMISVYSSLRDKIKINIFLSIMCAITSLGLTFYFFYILFLD